MNSENCKTSDPHRLLRHRYYYLTDKINLKRPDKYDNLNTHFTSKNIKKSCKNKKFKISAPTLNDKFQLPE